VEKRNFESGMEIEILVFTTEWKKVGIPQLNQGTVSFS
jgi:hypothetical protein